MRRLIDASEMHPRRLGNLFVLVVVLLILEKQRTWWERAEEHAYKSNNQKEQSAIYEHLLACEHYKHIVDLFNVDNNSFNLNKFNICQIRNNCY